MATAIPDTNVLLDLDFDHTPACEGQHHADGTNDWGHNPAQSASWVMVAPCCGPKMLICDARRAFILSQYKGMHCSTHNRVYTISEVVFTPI
jgi:hypothetical protein